MAIQLFSLLVVVMMFNSWSLNWTTSRLDTARQARFLYECADPPSGLTVEMKDDWAVLAIKDREILEGYAADWVSRCTGIPEKGSLNRELLGAASFLLRRGFSQGELSQHIQRLEDFRLQNVSSFPVPLIGVRIDVNGLGIFAGLGFATLLLWFGLSLSRESANIAYIKEEPSRAKAMDLILAESLFAPHSSKKGSRAVQRALELVPVVALSFPLALLVLQLWNDWGPTFSIGSAVDFDLASATIAAELILISVNLALLVWCSTLYQRVLKEWDAHEKAEAEHDSTDRADDA